MNNDQSFEDNILSSFEHGEWRLVDKHEAELTRYRELAATALRKSQFTTTRPA